MTKNPKRLIGVDWPANAWAGTTVDYQYRVEPAEEAIRQIKATVRFVVCEPLQEELTFSDLSMFDRIMIGGRSRSSGMAAGQPDWRWVEKPVDQARKAGLKILFKPILVIPDSAARLQEFPTANGVSMVMRSMSIDSFL